MPQPGKTVRFGLIGCGRVANQFYLPIFPSLSGGRLSAVADCDPNQLEPVRRRFPGIKTFADHRQLLREGGIEAVVVGTPPYLHADMTIDAIRAGVHVLVEKPFTTSLADAERVVNAAKGSGVKVMVGFNRRRYPRHQQARRFIAGGAFGESYAGESTLVGANEGSWRPHTDYHLRRATGGGTLFEFATHQIDLVRFIFGHEIVAVRCHLESRHSEDDTAWLNLTLDQGAIVNVFSGFGPSTMDRLEILLEGGRLSIPSSYASLQLGERSLSDFVWSPARYLKDYLCAVLATAHRPWHLAHRSHVSQLTEFMGYIRRDQEPSPGVADGLANARVIGAAYQSAERDGEPVVIA